MELLKDKKVLITGGTSGIGRAIALSFAEQGAHVTIFGTNEERAKQVVDLLKEARKSETQIMQYDIVDVGDHKNVSDAISKLHEKWAAVDVLVNCAGITRDGLLMRMSEEDWDDVINTNLKSVYNLCRTVIRPMMKNRSGKIINITSVVGMTGSPGQANYAASKAGMIGFTKALACELGPRNICVNCIAPGFIQTKMTDVLTDKLKSQIMSKIPMARFGSPEDIANAAIFLASALSDYVTGQVITVDGGMIA